MSKKQLDDLGIEDDDMFQNELNSFDDPGMDDLPTDDINQDAGFDFDGGSGGVAAMDKHKDLLRDLTNFDPFLKDMFNTWLGLVWDEESQKYVKSEFINQMLNYKGAAWALGVLKVYARPNNIITHIEKDEYVSIMMQIIDLIWFNLGSRMEEFEIKSNGDMITIATQLEHSAGLILMGAGGGKYSDLLTKTTSRSESVQLQPGGGPAPVQYQGGPQPPQKPRNMLGKLRNAFGGN